MLLKLIIILQVALFCGTGAWYNGPDGKEATEGTVSLFEMQIALENQLIFMHESRHRRIHNKI